MEKVRYETQDKKNRARHWVINGAVTQDAMCKYVWVKSMSARSAEDLRLKSTGCVTASGEKSLRLQMSAEGDHKC